MSSVPRGRKRDDIQVLRAIAVLAVIVFHFDESWLPGGYLGVDIFFVISGYLITGLVSRALSENRFSLAEFYFRRVKRLFPALAAMLFVSTLVAIAFVPPIPFQAFADHLPFAALQVANFSFMQAEGYFDLAHEQNALLHTWSLGVEEQFYAVWAPLLVLAFARLGRNRKNTSTFRPLAWMAGIGVVGLAAEWATLAAFGSDIAFFSPLSRSWEFAIGGFAAFLSIAPSGRGLRPVLLSLAYLGIVASLMLLPAEASVSPLLRSIPCLATFLLLVQPEATPPKHLQTLQKVGVYVGDASYSLYLWHWPVICFCPYLINSHDPLPNLLWATGLILVSSLGAYHLIERPLHRSQDWQGLFAPRTAVVTSIMGVLAGAGFALKTEADSSWRFASGEPTAAEKNYVRPRQFTELADPGQSFKRAGRAEAVLIGDSHARHFTPLFRQWCEERGLDSFVFFRDSFFALDCDTERSRGDARYTKDRETAARLHESLLENESLQVLFVAQRSDAYLRGKISDRHYRNALEDFVRPFPERGVPVVLLGQTPSLARLPKPGASIADRLLQRDWRETDLWPTEEELSKLHVESEAYENLATDAGIYYLPTSKLLTQPYTDEGVFLYDDDNHLNYRGAMSFEPALNSLLSPLKFKSTPKTR